MPIKIDFIMITILLTHILAEFAGKHSGVDAISITVHPPNVTTQVGKNVILPCIYSDSVNCVWKRNKYVMTIIGRYKYLQNENNGRNTSNCSIAITPVENIDNGTWQCSMTISLKQKSAVQSFLGKITVISSSEMVLKNLVDSNPKIAELILTKSVSSTQESKIQESSTFKCLKDEAIIGEPILIAVTIGTTMIALLLLAIVICICLQRRNEQGMIDENLGRIPLSFRSDYDDTDHLLHVLPTLPELERIESFRRSTLSRKIRANNSNLDSKFIHYAEIDANGFLVLKPLRNSSFASRISQISNSVPDLVINPFHEDHNGYLNPKAINSPIDKKVQSPIPCTQAKNRYGHIHKLEHVSESEGPEPIYLEVK